MADDDQNNDEYQFADLDGLGTEVELPADDMGAEGLAEEGVSSPPGRGRFDALNPEMLKIIRKGVLAVVALLVVLGAYKFGSSFFSSDTKDKKMTPTMAKATPEKAPARTMLPVTTNTTVKQTSPINSSEVASSKMSAKLSAITQKQNQIETDVSAMHKQMASATQAVNDMTTKMDDIKQTMMVLSERMEQQSQQVARLQTMRRAAPTASSTPAVAKKPAAPKVVYSVQAIIPGRAWLMSTQGTTLTVSRGTVVPGYGVVRMINSKLGRVFTSSGRVIQFSQADT